MAWIKMQDIKGRIINVPQGVYNNFYAHQDGFSIVQESKPSSVSEKKEKTKEEVVDNGTQEPKRNEDSNSRQGKKKAS